MIDPSPNTEAVEQAFDKVKELRELHLLIQSRLAALSVGAPKIAVSADAEYKALRDEIIHLWNRVFVLLAGMVGGSLVIFQHALDLRDAHPLRAWWLLVVLSCTLLVAMLLTCKIYDHIYRIRCYIAVYHETSVGWHVTRASGIIDFIRGLPDTNKWFFKFGEPDAIGLLYVALLLFASVMVSFVTPLASGVFLPFVTLRPLIQSAVAFVVLAIVFGYVIRKLQKVYAASRGSWESWWRAFKKQEEASKAV